MATKAGGHSRTRRTQRPSRAVRQADFGPLLSVNGWSDHVPGLLKQSRLKMVLMEGYDLRCVLVMHADLVEFSLAKTNPFNIDAEPFLGVREYLKRNDRTKPPPKRER